MTEAPAPRASVPSGAPVTDSRTPDMAPPHPDASTVRTALRERLVDAIDETYTTVDTFDACRAADAALAIFEDVLAEAEQRALRAERAARIFCDQRDEARAIAPPVDTSEAEHTGGNAEDCPVCRPLIDQPGGVLYPWHCTAGDPTTDEGDHP